MAKISGKKPAIPKRAEQPADEPKKKQVNLNVANSCLAKRKAASGRAFISVTIPLLVDGQTVFGSIAVDTGRVKQATRPLKDQNGQFKRTEDGRIMTERIPNRSNVWLLNADTKVKVNINRKNNDGTSTYETVVMTAEEVENAYVAAKEKYKQLMTQNERSGHDEPSIAGEITSLPDSDEPNMGS